MADKKKRDEQRYIAVDVSGREPPNNPEAEAAVIGAALTDGRHAELCGDLQPPEFHIDEWRRVWRAIQAIRARGGHIDFQTVGEQLRGSGEINAVGGLAALVKVIDTTPMVPNVGAYATIIRSYAHARRVIEAAQVIAGEGLSRVRSPGDFVEWASKTFDEVISGGPRKHGIERIGETGKWRVEQYHQQWAGTREPFGMRTQWARINGLTRGRSLGALRFVGGFTSSGKSSYCEEEALFISGRPYLFPRRDNPAESEMCDVATLYLTLEMPKVNVYDRAVVQLARVSLDELLTGKSDVDGAPLSAAARADIDAAVKALDELPFYYDDANQSLESIVQAVRLVQGKIRQHSLERVERGGRPLRLGIVYLDHFHITDENDDREVVSALGRLAKGLKRLAVSEMLHVCALVQFNREAPKRGERDSDSLPQIHDIKYGGSIEQAADDIELVHRKWLSIPDKTSTEAQECREDAVVVRGKGRNGRLGLVRMRFQGEHYHFEEKQT